MSRVEKSTDEHGFSAGGHDEHQSGYGGAGILINPRVEECWLHGVDRYLLPPLGTPLPQPVVAPVKVKVGALITATRYS